MSTVISKIFDETRDPFYKRGEKRGLKQGLERGLEQGLERGLEQGLEQGLERGIEQGTTQLIQKLIANTGSTDAEISRITDVPVETIRKIRAEMKKAD